MRYPKKFLIKLALLCLLLSSSLLYSEPGPYNDTFDLAQDYYPSNMTQTFTVDFDCRLNNIELFMQMRYYVNSLKVNILNNDESLVGSATISGNEMSSVLDWSTFTFQNDIKLFSGNVYKMTFEESNVYGGTDGYLEFGVSLSDAYPDGKFIYPYGTNTYDIMFKTDVTDINDLPNFLPQTITFNSLPTQTFGDSAFHLTATASSQLPITYTSSDSSVASISGSLVSIHDVGSTTITASQNGDSNYMDAENVSQTLSISQASQTISFGPLSAVEVDSPSFDLSATATSALPVNFSSSDTSVATVSGTTVTIIGAGSTTIIASQVGNSQYLQAPNVNQTLAISKKTQSILSDGNVGAKAVKLGNLFSIVRHTTSGLTPTCISSNSSVATVQHLHTNTYLVSLTGIGTTVITTSQSGNDTYLPAQDILLTLTVTAKDIPDVIFSNPAPINYGTALNSNQLNASCSIPGTITYNHATGDILESGINLITATFFPADSATYSSNTSHIYLNVQRAPLTVTARASTKKFGEPNPSLAYTISGFVNGDSESDLDSPITISTNALTSSDVGIYKITPASQLNNNLQFDNNYSLSFIEAPFTISKAESSISSLGNYSLKIGETLDLSTIFQSTANIHLTFSVEAPSLGAVSDTILTAISEGVINITASSKGNHNYEAPNDFTQSILIEKKDNHITNNLPNFISYGMVQAASNFAPSSTSGDIVIISSSNTSVIDNDLTVIGSGVATLTYSSIETNEFMATISTHTITISNTVPIVSLSSIPTQAKVGETTHFSGTISDSDFSYISWLAYSSSDNSLIASGNGKIIDFTTVFNSGDSEGVYIIANDGDKITTSTISEIDISASSSVSGNGDVFSGVDSSVSTLDNSISERQGSIILDNLAMNTSGIDFSDSLKAFTATLSSNTSKTFTSGNMKVLAFNSTIDDQAVIGSINIHIPAGNTIAIAANIDRQEFENLPETAIYTFTIDLFDSEGNEITEGFSLTNIIKGIVSDPTIDYKIYTADFNGNFNDTGFITTIVNDTDLHVTMTHFSTFSVIEETPQVNTNSSNSGGGGCLLK